MRITQKHLEAKISIVNKLMGHEDTDYSTIGALRLYGAYGGVAVHRVCNENGGVSNLTSIGTKREVALFLDGMIAALRIADEA